MRSGVAAAKSGRVVGRPCVKREDPTSCTKHALPKITTSFDNLPLSGDLCRSTRCTSCANRTDRFGKVIVISEDRGQWNFFLLLGAQERDLIWIGHRKIIIRELIIVCQLEYWIFNVEFLDNSPVAICGYKLHLPRERILQMKPMIM